MPLAKSKLLLSKKRLPCLPVCTAIGIKYLHAREEHAAIPYGLSNAGATGGLCQVLPAERSRCVFHPCWPVWCRGSTCCPVLTQAATGSALLPISRFLSIVSPCIKDPVQLTSPPAYCFSFTVISSKGCHLGDPVHAAAFGAGVPPAEHAVGGPGSPRASQVEGRCLDIIQSGEMREWCLKAFVFKSLLPSLDLHVGYIQL